jgi:hypothetical protein
LIAAVHIHQDTAQLLEKGREGKNKVQSTIQLVTNVVPKLKLQFKRNFSDRM